MKSPLSENIHLRRVGSQAYGLLCLAACLLWLRFAIYLWGMGRYNTFPTIPWLQQASWKVLGFDTTRQFSGKIYILCSTLPVLVYFLLSLKKKKPLFRITAWVLVTLTTFFGLFVTELVYGNTSLRRFLNGTILGSGAAQQERRIQLFGTVYICIFLAALAGMLLLSLVQLLRWIRKATPAAWRLQGKNAACSLALGFLLPVASLLMLTVADRYFGDVSSFVYKFCSSNARQLSLLLVSILYAPFFEEIAFRGVMLSLARKALPTWLAVIITTVCFGLWHRNLSQFLYTTLMGFAFASVALSTGGIWYSMLFHFLDNLIVALGHSNDSGCVLGKQVFFVSVTDWLKSLSFWPALLGLLLSLILIVLILRYLHRINQA